MYHNNKNSQLVRLKLLSSASFGDFYSKKALKVKILNSIRCKHYIKSYLEREVINIWVSAIENILNNIYMKVQIKYIINVNLFLYNIWEKYVLKI